MRRSDDLILRKAAIAALVTVLSMAIGCTISERDNERGSKDAEIRTPVGGLKVQTNIDPKDVGLAVYPGARLKPSGDSDKDKSANVNISTPFFGLRVIALDYETDDPPAKVLDFYKKELSRYGRVVECKNSSPSHVNNKDQVDMKFDLKCDDTGSGNSTELKAGEGNAQHIVGVTPQTKGTEFGLVYIQIRGKAETM
jgi:hypothetical protein